MPSTGEMVLRLLLSTVLGSLIGLERETHGRPAGLRTHILVCLGSTLFTIASYIVAGKVFDPRRITAQIVTGVGFLGAGTIIHQGSVVRGLTTAASIWTIAAIGVAVGIGGQGLILGVITAVILFTTLNFMPKVERYISGRRSERTLSFTISVGPEAIACVINLLSSHRLRLLSLTHEDAVDQSAQVMFAKLEVPSTFNEEAFNHELATNDCVISYGWV